MPSEEVLGVFRLEDLNRSPYFVEALAKGLHVLSVFSEDNPYPTLTEVAQQAGLDKSTTFRLLQTLVDLGFVNRDTEKRYHLTARVCRLGFTLVNTMGVRTVAKPFLEELFTQADQTVNLVVLDGPDIVYVDRIQKRRLIATRLDIGSRLPAHATALGKAILAFLPETALEEVMARVAWVSLTPNTITEPSALRQELQAVRRQGLAIDDEELAPGIRGVAAPILSHRAEPAGAIGVAASAGLLDVVALREVYAPMVIATARRISETMGFKL